MPYTHTYTRDTSIIIQEAWFRAHTMGLNKIFDWVNPYAIPSVYVAREGAIEAWDDEEAYQWIRDQLQKEVVKRPGMMQELVQRYEGKARMLGALSARGCPTDARAFLEYLELVLEAVIHFIVIHHIGSDERTPALARETALRIEKKDALLDKHDQIIRTCLRGVYPELQGCETLIRYREVKYDQVASRDELERRKQGWVIIPGEAYEIGSLEQFSQNHPSIIFKTS